MRADPVTAWARRVAEGKVRACRPVRWAAERHLRDLEREDLVWRPEAAGEIVAFFREHIRHYKGPMAGKALELEPWQVFGLGSVFGWFLKDGRRRFREAYWEVPRGNGKTAVAAGVALFGLVLDGEAAPDVYTVATKEDQAKIAWRDAVAYTRNSPELAALMQVRVKEVRCAATDGVLKPLGSDSTTLDGLNPHVVVADEIHEWKSDALYAVLRTAMAKRRNPLLFSITTAGFNRFGFGAQVHETGMRVLDPDQPDWENDRFFYYIWQMDEPEKWRTRKQWALANPMLGKSLLVEDMAEVVRTAHMPPNSEREVKVKRLNHWGADEGSEWLPMSKWKACLHETAPGEWEERPRKFAALDLAEVHDLTALVGFAPPAGVQPGIVRAQFWAPSEDVRQRTERDGVPYEEWAKQGWITLVPGEVTDFHFVERDVVRLAEEWGFSSLGMDPWKGKDLAQRLRDDHGLDVVEVRQGFATMSPLCNELLRLVSGGLVEIEPNPVMDWMAGNTTVRLDPAGNVKPDKAKARERIDGIVAWAMAIGVALEAEDTSSVYDSPALPGAGIFL